MGKILGAAGYHAIAFDARGHGDSEWASDGAYGQDVMVQAACAHTCRRV
jgi:non-heme chloroperoxidase